MSEERFIDELKKINVEINDIQLYQLKEYYSLIIEKNKVMNLTGITEKKDFYLKHFYDSLTLNRIINLKNINNLCDMGTGAGFPGIVIKILFPNIKITLLDSLNKRIIFLKEVIEKLQLKDIEIYHTRAEEFSRENTEKFDIVTARAVSKLSNLLEYSSQMIKIDGFFIAMKSNIDNEIIESKNALNKLKMQIDQIEEFNLPIEESKRTLIRIQKKESTPKKYPRKMSEIKKTAL